VHRFLRYPDNASKEGAGANLIQRTSIQQNHDIRMDVAILDIWFLNLILTYNFVEEEKIMNNIKTHQIWLMLMLNETYPQTKAFYETLYLPPEEETMYVRAGII
jgi:hypothetical protein